MFKVGDLVRVRYHTDAEKTNYEHLARPIRIFWHGHMSEMEGNTYTIYITSEHYCKIKDNKGTWTFMTSSLIPVYDQF